MIQPFSGDSLTFDSLGTGAYYSTSPIPGAAFSRTISTDNDTISFPLDPALVTHWLDSTVANYGILLKPSNNSLIQGFSSYTTYDSNAVPVLTVHYTNASGENWYADTISTSRFLAHIDSTALVTDNSKIYVQSGSIYRGVITFDISKLPNPCFVNSATMELQQAASDVGGFVPDSVESLLINDSNSLLSSTLSISSTSNAGPQKFYRLGTQTVFAYWFKKLSAPRDRKSVV